MESRFEVVELNSGGGDNAIVALLARLLEGGARAPRFVPLENVAQAVSSLRARCAIVQRNVQDPDFLAEHAVYYSKWSAPISRYCTRVHFFSSAPGSQDALQVIDEMASIEESYLGFVTLRPNAVSPIAATIITPPFSDGLAFVTARDAFTVNLAGRRFEVNGTPFLQQDNAVGACAQASIWMALRTLRRKEGQAAYSLAQITNAATRFLVSGRTLPNRNGLSLDQIIEAVRASGYAPHIVPLVPRDNREPVAVPDGQLAKAKQSLYPYVESGIPVVLAVAPRSGQGHAVLVIGHGWVVDPVLPTPERRLLADSCLGVSAYDASNWLGSYIIHNDNTGPYQEFHDRTGIYRLEDALAAVPFLPADVFIDGAEAREVCLRLLEDVLSNNDPGASAESIPNIVVRLYLQDRSAFRATVIASTMSDEVKRYYRNKWLPRRIWVMEINEFEGYGGAPSGNAVRLGEILLDPTLEPATGRFLAIHLSRALVPVSDGDLVDGVIIDQDTFTGEIEAHPVREDPYTPRLS